MAEVIKTCLTCQKQFKPTRQSYNANQKVNYCSWKCRGLAYSKRAAEADHAERFWAKVDKSGDCWLWTGGIRTKGREPRGVFWLAGKRRSAARVAYALANNITDLGDLFVCHKCNNSLCVRPDHLYLGTHHDNMQDRKSAGNYRVPEERKQRYSIRFRGEGNHGGGKLKDADIPIIRSRFAAGETKTAISKSYGVSDTTICEIINGKAWTHV